MTTVIIPFAGLAATPLAAWTGATLGAHYARHRQHRRDAWAAEYAAIEAWCHAIKDTR